jgi:hypothetical protein
MISYSWCLLYISFPFLNVISVKTIRIILIYMCITLLKEGHRGRDHEVVGFTTTYAISAYHHRCCKFESRPGWGVQHYVIKVCPWLATGRWFSSSPPVFSANKTDRHDITEILLKVTLNTIKQTNKHFTQVETSDFSVHGNCLINPVSSDILICVY